MKLVLYVIIAALFAPAALNGEQVRDDGLLDVFNNIPMAEYIEIDEGGQGLPFKIVVLGNSMAHHGSLPEIGWNHNHGMAASAPERDYAHVLYAMTEDALPGRRIGMLISNLADFERNFDTYDLDRLSALREFRPDVVVIQLGGNTKFEGERTPELFEEKYSALIDYFKQDDDPVIVCVTNFFPSQDKDAIITRVASQTRSAVADLSMLLTEDEENYAKNEKDYPGDRSVWLAEGIGIHPGDKGMENMSRKIFEAMASQLKSIDGRALSAE